MSAEIQRHGSCGCGFGNEWIWILVVILIVCCCCGNQGGGFGGLFGCGN